jgi:hypothetical protein
MKKTELKQLIRETIEEVRIISEANKITEYLQSNPRLVESLMAHGVLSEADMGRRDFLKKLGMGLAGAGLTAAGLRGAESDREALDPKKVLEDPDFLAEVHNLLEKYGVNKQLEKARWNIFELPDYGIALETVLVTHEDPYGGNRFNEFSKALDGQIEYQELIFKNSKKQERDHHDKNDRIFVVLKAFKKIEKPLYGLIVKYMKKQK